MRAGAPGVLALATWLGLLGCTSDDTAVAGPDSSVRDATLDARGYVDAADAELGDAGDAEVAAPAPDAAIPSPAAACAATGGVLATVPCCMQSGDYPDTCSVGACACAPQYSLPTKVCSCPPGTCFGATVPGCVVWDGGLFPP
jgi:hypothetical protein